MIAWRPGERPRGLCVDIRDTADHPWCRLSPDYQHGQIPVPGITGMYSETVRGCAEGLKVTAKPGFPGRINPGYFGGPGRARELRTGEHVQGWRYRSRNVSIRDARLNIEIPAYLWVLKNPAANLVTQLRRLSRDQPCGMTVWDGIDNIDLSDPAPLSYAALFCAYINDDIGNFRAGTFVSTPGCL